MIHDDLPVSVKLNSDDLRKGGFSHDDCLAVVARLNDDRIDLLENSGEPVRVLYEERFTQAAHGAGR